jgi:hypothetical protein
MVATKLGHALRGKDRLKLSDTVLQRLDVVVLAEWHGILRDIANAVDIQSVAFGDG